MKPYLRRGSAGRLRLAVWALGGLAWTVGAADAQLPEGPTVLEQPAEPLRPRTPRSEADQDRLTAAAHFAHGRLLMLRGDRLAALRRFQRAWRYDPRSEPLLRDIIALATRLGRADEATRYAVIATENNPRDPRLLTQLAAFLVDQKDRQRALRFFDKALKLYEQDDDLLSALALRIEMGRLYFLEGRHAEAARTLAPVADARRDPERAGITRQQSDQLVRDPKLLNTLMLEAFLEADQLDEAQQVLRDATELRQNQPLLEYHQARVDYARGDFESARRRLQRYFDAGQSEAGIAPYELLHKLLRKSHDEPQPARLQLLDELQRLYRADRDNAVMGYYLAQQLREAKQWSQAEEVYLDLLLSQPAAQAYQGLTEIYYRLGKVDELVEILGDTLGSSGTTAAITPQIALITNDKPFLARLLDHVIQHEDRAGQAVRLVAALMAVSGRDLERAEKLYESALQAEGMPKHEVMQRYALALFFADRTSRAAEIFRQAIDQQPGQRELATYYYYLAGALELAGQTERAVEAAETAAELNDSLLVQTRPAWVLYHARQYERAEGRYRELLERFDGSRDDETRRAMRDVRLALSNIAVQQGNLEEAVEWLEQVLDEFPEDVGALNDLGYLWADQGKHLNRALAMVERAVRAEPENEAYRDSLGWALFRLGRYEEAVRELEKAAGVEKPDGVILDHLGDAYWQLGQQEDALRTWRRAVDALDGQRDAKVLEATRKKIEKHQSKVQLPQP